MYFANFIDYQNNMTVFTTTRRKAGRPRGKKWSAQKSTWGLRSNGLIQTVTETISD